MPSDTAGQYPTLAQLLLRMSAQPQRPLRDWAPERPQAPARPAPAPPAAPAARQNEPPAPRELSPLRTSVAPLTSQVAPMRTGVRPVAPMGATMREALEAPAVAETSPQTPVRVSPMDLGWLPVSGAGIAQAASDPTSGLARAMQRSGAELRRDMAAGNYAGAVGTGIRTAVPVLGQTLMAEMGDDFQKIPDAAGRFWRGLTGQAAETPEGTTPRMPKADAIAQYEARQAQRRAAQPQAQPGYGSDGMPNLLTEAERVGEAYPDITVGQFRKLMQVMPTMAAARPSQGKERAYDTVVSFYEKKLRDIQQSDWPQATKAAAMQDVMAELSAITGMNPTANMLLPPAE